MTVLLQVISPAAFMIFNSSVHCALIWKTYCRHPMEQKSVYSSSMGSDCSCETCCIHCNVRFNAKQVDEQV